jgi:hypothetical protein
VEKDNREVPEKEEDDEKEHEEWNKGSTKGNRLFNEPEQKCKLRAARQMN